MPRPRFSLPPWSWRQPRREAGPIRLTTRRLYILPTRHGLLFGALLFALLWGSLNYNLNLGYLFTFLLASIGTLAMVHTQRNLAGLELRADAPPPVFAGEDALFRLRVETQGRDRYGLLLAGADRIAQLADLTPDNGLELRLPQPRRGFHRPGRMRLSSTYPLGLFRCWTLFELEWGVLVYPAPASQALPLPASRGGGQGDSLGSGEEEFDGLRPYLPGDSPRRIAWKQAARSQGLVTKQFVAETGGELWLDWSLTPEPGTEEKLSRLTRWALDAEAQAQPWGMRLPNRQIPMGRGNAHLRQCLEALARHGLV